MELIVKDIYKPRLTVAADRVTLKVPIGMQGETVAYLQKFAEQVSSSLQNPEFTYRGQFGSDLTYIIMHTGRYRGASKNIKFVYHE